MATRLVHIEALFKALADATRLRILALLVGGEICVCEIHDALKLPQPTVSRHLAYLRRSGLVATRREGMLVHYRIASPDVTVLRTLTEIVTHALSHVDTIAKDGDRLRQATGCCLKTAAVPRGLACCGEATA